MTVPATGWYVEVEHPSTSYTHTPRVVDSEAVGPQYPPRANAVPEVRVPVPKDPTWRDLLDADADAAMRVWKDGERLPIDTLEDVEETVAGGTAYDVLVGSGGDELGQRVTQSYDQKAVHLAAKDLVANNTSLATNVDTPPTTTQSDVTLLTLSSTSDFLSRTAIPTSLPAEVSGGSLRLLQTAFTTEGEDFDANNGSSLITGSSYSDGNAEALNAVGDWVEYEFVLDHRIPAGDFGVGLRRENTGSDALTLDVTVQDSRGSTVLDIGSFNIGGSASLTHADEVAVGNLPESDSPLDPGTYRLRLEVTSSGSDSQGVLDVVTPLDQGGSRFTANYTFDNDNGGSGGYLDGPEYYPESVEVTLDAAVAPQAVTGGRAEATLNGGESNYTHFLSNDQGASFDSGTGATFESDSIGTTWGPSLTYKAGLARWGSTTGQTPLTGINGHELQSLTLKADLEDMPLIVNTTVDGHISSILSDQFATAADAIWTVSQQSGGQRLEWTQPGQRTADDAPDIAQYQAAKSVGSVYHKAVVYGQADVPRVDVRFQANHGTAVSLRDDRLQADTVVVTDPDTGTRYRREQDYTLDAQAGEITTLASGRMTDGATYAVDYRYQAYGEYDDGTANPATADPVELPGLRTDFACEQAARLIVEEVNDPQRTATATIPADATSWSVVEALDPPIVPTDGEALHVKSVENTPQQTVLTLGNRRSVGDVVEQIRSQVSAVSRKA